MCWALNEGHDLLLTLRLPGGALPQKDIMRKAEENLSRLTEQLCRGEIAADSEGDILTAGRLAAT